MFGAGLMLIIRRYVYVYTVIGMCHAFMLTGWAVSQYKCMPHSASCWFLSHKYVYITEHGPQTIKSGLPLADVMKCRWKYTD